MGQGFNGLLGFNGPRMGQDFMDTERQNPRYAGIDGWAPTDIVAALIESQIAAVATLSAARAAIERAAGAAAARLVRGGRLIYAGAGTSGRLAAQDGAELAPTFNWPRARQALLLAGGRRALLQAVEGAEDDSTAARAQVRSHALGRNDVLIAVSASGRTPFTLACLRAAKARGALTVGIANSRGAPLLKDADCPILLETGSEPIAGSTRMKAGTAQRAALTVFSSLLMILLGRVYGGLMVEIRPLNAKLQRRSEDILVQLSHRPRPQVRAALAEARGNLKLALLLLRGLNRKEAAAALRRSGGDLRAALGRMGQPTGAPAPATRQPGKG